MQNLKKVDPQIYQEIINETNRQKNGLVMIPSENFTSVAVLETMATVLSNKYSEGYPQARYYTGNQYIDEVETMAINRAKELFEADHANVQPHSGTTANLAVYFALLEPGDKILSLDLSHGGHLSHGSPVSLIGNLYNVIHYGVDKETETINMDKVRKIALEEKPKLIVTGATAYPRKIDFAAFAEIAKEIDAYQLADIAHIAGLCATGVHQSPVPYADIVSTTTHKTLRGPRSAIILSKEEYAKKIDKAIFPGTQGGPLEHVIAAKAVCFKQAMTDQFKQDQEQTVKNAKTLADKLLANDIKLVSGGTDNHLLLLDVTTLNTTGKEAANALAEAGIYTNFNTIPFETRSPFDPSGLRMGTPALTTQGMKESEMEQIGQAIADILKNINDETKKEEVKKLVQELTRKFPIYSNLNY